MADTKKMEGHCATGQSPQWAVVPMEEEESTKVTQTQCQLLNQFQQTKPRSLTVGITTSVRDKDGGLHVTNVGLWRFWYFSLGKFWDEIVKYVTNVVRNTTYIDPHPKKVYL